MATTVVGRVNNAREAEGVVRDLSGICGCDRADISLLAQDGTRATKAYNIGIGTLKGIAAGIVIGGIGGFAAYVVPLPVPAIFEAVLASGPVASAIVGAFIGAIAGGALGALISAASSLGETEPGNVRHPGTVITVHARNEREAGCAVSVMRQHSVMEIDRRSSDWDKQDRTTPTEPVLRPDPNLANGIPPATTNPPATGSPSLRSNRLPEAAEAKPSAVVPPVPGSPSLRSNRLPDVAAPVITREAITATNMNGPGLRSNRLPDPVVPAANNGDARSSHPPAAAAPAANNGNPRSNPPPTAAALAASKASLQGNRPATPAPVAALESASPVVTSREGWITRSYIATYFGPERRKAANQHPYQGAERRHSA